MRHTGYDEGRERGRGRGWKMAVMMGGRFGHGADGGHRGRGHGGGDGFGDGFDGPRRGRRGRVLDGEGLRLLLLHLIAEKPGHGYELMKAVEELSGGQYAPSPGVLYPMLTLLADMGLIAEADSDGNRRAYALSDAGRTYLETHREAADAALARITALAGSMRGRDAAPAARAMMNLGAALANRLKAAGADRETALKAAAIIDRAAQEVERL